MTLQRRTQKAQSLEIIHARRDFFANYLGCTALDHCCISDDDEVINACTMLDRVKVPIFARPCPVTPQHGFVESRVCHTGAALLATWLDARDADPDAELILMRPIHAQRSAIITSDSISIGTGHDGATAGRAGTWSLPFTVSLTLPQSITAGARIPADKAWFAEIVQNTDTENTRFLVQLRAGERGAATSASLILPNTPYLVTAICDGIALVDAPFTLIQRTIAALPAGALLYLPGVNASCHIAVQATARGIAVACGDTPRPAIGDSLTGPSSVAATTRAAAFLAGIHAGLLAPLLSDTKAAVGALATALHQSTLWSHSSNGNEALGIAVAFMLRLGIAAGWGEARHARGAHKPGTKYRDHVYLVALEPGPFALRSSLGALLRMFARRNWAKSYGGRAWARCTAALIQLDLAVAALVRWDDAHQHNTHKKGKKPAALSLDPETLLGNIGTAFNVVVNEAHNGGWWLNKFVPVATLSDAANAVPSTLVSATFTLHAATDHCHDRDRATTLAPFLNKKHETKAFYALLAKPREASTKKFGSMNSMKLPVPSENACEKVHHFSCLLSDVIAQGYPIFKAPGNTSLMFWHVQLKALENSTYTSFSGPVLASNANLCAIAEKLAAATARAALSVSFSGSGAFYVPLTATAVGLELLFDGIAHFIPLIDSGFVLFTDPSGRVGITNIFPPCALMDTATSDGENNDHDHDDNESD